VFLQLSGWVQLWVTSAQMSSFSNSQCVWGSKDTSDMTGAYKDPYSISHIQYIWTLQDFAGRCVEKLLPLQMSFKEQYTQKWRFCHHLLTEFLSSVGHKMRFTKSFKPQTMARGCQAQAQSAKNYHKRTRKIVGLTCVPY